MNDSICRIYLGARGTHGRVFTPQDEKIMHDVLGRFFHGWTIQKGEGHWQGESEETRVITVVDAGANHREPGTNTLRRCAEALKAALQQASLLVENKGSATEL